LVHSWVVALKPEGVDPATVARRNHQLSFDTSGKRLAEAKGFGKFEDHTTGFG
jgi:hypothetical protein